MPQVRPHDKTIFLEKWVFFYEVIVLIDYLPGAVFVYLNMNPSDDPDEFSEAHLSGCPEPVSSQARACHMI